MLNNNIDIYKLALIGNSGVGKSCFLRRFIEDQYDANYQGPFGVDIQTASIQLKSKNIKLQVWDVNLKGQRFYNQSADALMLLFDSTDMTTFKNMNELLEQAIQDSGRSTPIILVSNKSDLTVTYGSVPRQAIEDFIENSGYDIQTSILTSAKTGENVHAAFLRAAEIIYNSKKSKKTPENEKDFSPHMSPRP